MTAFWEPPMRTSMPQPSMSRCVVPRPVMASTMSRASLTFSLRSLAMPSMSWRTPVEDSVAWTKTARVSSLSAALDLVEREGAAVRSFDHVDVAAEGFGEAAPALAELAGGEDEDAVAGRGEVGDGGLHGAGAAAREDDDVVLGADEVLELGEDAGVECAELRACGGECLRLPWQTGRRGASGVGPGVKSRVLRIMSCYCIES